MAGRDPEINASDRRQNVRRACADVIMTCYLFHREQVRGVPIEQVERISAYDQDDVREAIVYLIAAGYLVDATKRNDVGDKRAMNCVQITKPGMDLALRNTADTGVDFGD